MILLIICSIISIGIYVIMNIINDKTQINESIAHQYIQHITSQEIRFYTDFP